MNCSLLGWWILIYWLIIGSGFLIICRFYLNYVCATSELNCWFCNEFWYAGLVSSLYLPGTLVPLVLVKQSWGPIAYFILGFGEMLICALKFLWDCDGWVWLILRRWYQLVSVAWHWLSFVLIWMDLPCNLFGSCPFSTDLLGIIEL
jgi:hypothetical protein